MSTVKIKRSGTTTSTPSSLDHGELAINYADSTLFWKDATNTIRSFVFQAYALATHKSQHATGGTDALTPSDIGAAPAASPVFSGNVGIGTSPTSFNSSFNNVVIGDGSSVEGMTIYSSTQGTLAFGDTATTGADGYRGYLAYIHSGDYMAIGTGGAERFRAYASGVIVSGVITVSAGTAAAPAIVASGDSNTGLLWPAADTVAISTAGVERVRVDSSGRVGIGASPSYAVDVHYNDSYQLRLKRTGSGQAGLRLEDSSGNFHQLASASNIFVVTSGATERLRLDASGRFGVGTTGPTALLDVNSDTIRLRTARTPASASASGNAGDICWDASYLYICTATNTWRRIAHSTW